MRRGILSAICVLAIAAAAVPVAAQAEPGDPPYLPITDLLPPLTGAGGQDSGIPCANGSPLCVHHTLHRMHRMLRRDGCDHKGLFLANYIVVTNAYNKIAHTPDGKHHSHYFDDPAWLAREDAMFAKQYFTVRRRWSKPSQRDRVAPAWALSLQAADDHSMTGLGDLILGISAHVNNDMPFMLAATGLRDANGRSHKRDHDRFNRNLSDSFDDVLEDVARRYDPLANVDVPGTELEKTAIYQLLALWREAVWRNAERLENARSNHEREQVAQSIQEYAVNQSRLVMPFFKASANAAAARDGYCNDQLAARGGRQ
ncbi:MAG: hypothetical protein QOG62_2694 [Thermoleophilaceae bacterium]|jgi:hypothetical protein|nr:hypothetical protein [Thermoleophilaceae bacterium]